MTYLSSFFLLICRYVQYSQIAARVVRQSLRGEMRAEAEKRGDGLVNMKKWVNGKPEGTTEIHCIIPP